MGGPGAGHMLDMINRMKANRSKRPSNYRYRHSKELVLKANGGKKLSFRNCSPETLQSIREKFELEKKKEFKTTIIRITLSLAITIVSFSLVAYILKHYFFTCKKRSTTKAINHIVRTTLHSQTVVFHLK
jgi:hypothetical protein